MRHNNGFRRAALATTAVTAFAAAVTGILPGSAMSAVPINQTPPPLTKPIIHYRIFLTKKKN
ncbi:hypothetical protein PV413_39740 [Streptomyces scabiei]|uniref:hypothetical protein n=1 Tax=Streptomyces scabiei TaxID=1930 RepID=UPI0029A9B911|nr:hypothetical protein [Streptomyces scabiei]MDX3153546.1 hypothetical protein [Streptomyces scabiei]